MRTALTLDDDAAALLAEVRKAREAGLKTVGNEALHQGLQQMTIPAQPRRPYRTPAVSLGCRLVESLDDVAAQGDAFR